VAAAGFDPCVDVGGGPVAVDDEPLWAGGGDGGVPVGGEGVLGEDGHVGHGENEVFLGVVDCYVLCCSGRGVLVAELADV